MIKLWAIYNPLCILKSAKINFYVYFLRQIFGIINFYVYFWNRIMDEIRSSISPEMKLQMEMSVSIANRIYEILEAKGMTQKDLAKRLGKTETEVSRWLSGTHNLTLSTICKISAALGDPILKVVHQKDKNHAFECEPMMASEPLSAPEP